MADKKVSELDPITGADTAADDLFLIVDASGSVTKKITRAELNNAIEQDVLSTVDINGGTIDSTVIGGTTPAAGDFTTLGATGNITVGGTVDGRDVAADGTKLDGIASSATANPNAIDNVVEDTSPQLGGDLQSNGNDILFADSDKAIFGTGSDMSLFHNGNNAFLDNDTGTLFIQTDALSVKNAAGTESVMLGAADGAVTLYHDGFLKFETTSTGVAVTGNVVLNNATYLQFKDSGGTARDVLAIDAFNGLNINSAGGGAAAPIVFKENGSEIARFHTGGQLIAPNGVTLGTATGTYNSANTLDDYEEGTFTPTLGGQSGGEATYNVRAGTYTKIGRVVTVNVMMAISNKNTTSGNIVVGGLPFTVAAVLDHTSLEASGNISYFQNLATAFSCLNVAPFQSNTTLGIYGVSGTGSTTSSHLATSQIDNDFECRITCTYFAA